MTNSASAAEDLTQECFLALLRAPRRYDPSRGSMKVYLFSIARDLALKQFRDEGGDWQLEESQHPVAADPSRSIEISAAVSAAGTSPSTTDR